MRHGLLEALAPEVPNERRPNTWLLELIALTDARFFFTAVRLMVTSIQMPNATNHWYLLPLLVLLLLHVLALVLVLVFVVVVVVVVEVITW